MARRIPLDSSLALFAPEHYLVTPVPAPLYLLEFVPGTLTNFYPTNPDGTLRDRESYFHERSITYATGAAIHVQAVGSPRHGLPMQHDSDILLGLLRMADQGGVRSDGSFIQPSYRGILRAASRDTLGADAIPSVKRALARWTVTVHTEASLDFRELAGKIEVGDARPRTPPATPERTKRTTAYSVLEYSFDTEVRKEQTVDTISHLRINPVWLSQSRAGIAAWIDVDAHNALRSPWAKRIYQHLAARAALGWRPQEVLALTLPDFLQALAVRSGRRPTEDAKQVRSALASLELQGVVMHGVVRRMKKGLYEVLIEGGDRLIGASRLRGTGSAERLTSRMLLAHLRSFGVNDKDGLALIARSQTQVLSVLRRLHWLKSAATRDRSGVRPAIHPAKFIKSAVEGDYLFEEPAYQQWLAEQSRAALTDPQPAPVAKAIEPTPQAAELRKIEYPDNIWGRAIYALVRSGAVSEAAVLGYLLPARFVASSNRTVVVQAADTFAAQWIRTKYHSALTDALSEELGHQVQLTIQAADPSH